MAITNSPTHMIMLHANKTKMMITAPKILSNNILSSPKPLLQLSTSCRASKPFSQQIIYEDTTNGIVCYKDENGEMICEGGDEGPRYIHEYSEEKQLSRQKKVEDVEYLLFIQNFDQKYQTIIRRCTK